MWSELLANTYNLTLLSFAIGGATVNTVPGYPTSADEVATYHKLMAVKRDLNQPSAAFIELGSAGVGRVWGV